MKFRDAFNNVGRTINGALTNASSGSALLNLFSIAGASRGMTENQILTAFHKAWKESPQIALKILFQARDIHQGRGERRFFRTIFAKLTDYLDNETVFELCRYIEDFGRFDDLFVSPIGKRFAIEVLKYANKGGNVSGLFFKWYPRKGKMFKSGQIALGMTAKEFRKFLVSRTNVVETKMCAKDWDNIVLKQVPSLAIHKYKAAFSRHIDSFREAVKKGEIKQTHITPTHLVYDAIGDNIPFYSHTNWERFKINNAEQIEIANNMWKRLGENFPIDFNGNSFIPVCDVSGSMTDSRYSGSVKPIHSSIGLSLFLAENQKGPFKDLILSFSSDPFFIEVDSNDTLVNNIGTIISSEIGYSTNIQKTFEVLLDKAVAGNVAPEDMPKTMIIFSDMEFNYSAIEGKSVKALDAIKKMYANAGYTCPKLVFWNLNARPNNFPAMDSDTGAILYSGFSPRMVTEILSAPADATPLDFMLSALNTERLSFIDELIY